MILVDSSVWVEHLRKGLPELAGFLDQGDVATHPFIIGELACGRMTNRKEILSLLERLPASPLAGHDEVLRLIEDRALMGRGLGYVDVHLLASALLGSLPIWTLDAPLAKAASRLGVSYRG